MRRMKLGGSAAALAATIGLLAGCGGTKTVTHTTTVERPSVAKTTFCSGSNQALQCVLAKVGPPSKRLSAPATTVLLQGVDFAWTKLPPSQAGGFAASYISADPSKDWNTSLISAYHAAHKGTVAVFEEGGTQAADGCARGAADARFAEGVLTSWGYPHSHFDMAIDFDASPSQVLPYFQCANRAEPGLVGAYGGYRPLQALCAAHVVTKSWQTYAWSGGAWLPASCAPLEQWLNGSTYDHDRTLAADYGQFPSPAPPPPPHPFYYQRFAAPCYHGAVQFPLPCKGVAGGPFKSKWGKLIERQVVVTYDHLRPHWRKNHSQLLKLRYEMQYLAARLVAAGHGNLYWRKQRIVELKDRGVKAVECQSWAACVRPR